MLVNQKGTAEKHPPILSIFLLLLFIFSSTASIAESIDKQGIILAIESLGKKGDRLIATNISGDDQKIASPLYHSISSIAYCAEQDLIAYTIKDKSFKTKAYLKKGIDGEPLSLPEMIVEDFSSDCKSLIHTVPGKSTHLYLYLFKDKISKSLIQLPKLAIGANWSPDNRVIVLWLMGSLSKATGDLYLLSYPELVLKRLTNTPEVNEIYPSFLDDETILYNVTAAGKTDWEVATLNLETGLKKLMGIKGMYPRAISEGRAILYDKNNQIHLFDTETSRSTVIASGGRALWLGSNSADKHQEKQACDDKEIDFLIEKADALVQKGEYEGVMEMYRKIYSICPIRDLEEVMAWLLSELEVKKEAEVIIK